MILLLYDSLHWSSQQPTIICRVEQTESELTHERFKWKKGKIRWNIALPEKISNRSFSQNFKLASSQKWSVNFSSIKYDRGFFFVAKRKSNIFRSMKAINKINGSILYLLCVLRSIRKKKNFMTFGEISHIMLSFTA